jgi:Flp pilus assembly protein TadD
MVVSPFTELPNRRTLDFIWRCIRSLLKSMGYDTSLQRFTKQLLLKTVHFKRGRSNNSLECGRASLTSSNAEKVISMNSSGKWGKEMGGPINRIASGRVCFAAVALYLLASISTLHAQVASGPSLQVTSALGRKLYSLADDESVAAARKKLAADPKNVELVLALSKAEAGRRQYKEAVATCTEGLAFAPKDADLYVERGHRELGLREFAPASQDLKRATELAPQNLDAFYHLGLARYFLGEFSAAAASFNAARALAKTNDSLIDTSNWLYVSWRRAGDEAKASEVLTRITPEVKNTEPHLFFYLSLLHFYQGKVAEKDILPPPAKPNDVEAELRFNTVSYGVGNWHYYHHETPQAVSLFSEVVKGEAWNSWGFIGSEVELSRLKK